MSRVCESAAGRDHQAQRARERVDRISSEDRSTLRRTSTAIEPIQVFDSQGEDYKRALQIFLEHTDQKRNATQFLQKLVDGLPTRNVFIDAGAGNGEVTKAFAGRCHRDADSGRQPGATWKPISPRIARRTTAPIASPSIRIVFKSDGGTSLEGSLLGAGP